MTRFRRACISPPGGPILVSAIFLSPIGMMLSEAAQVAPLPKSFYPLVEAFDLGWGTFLIIFSWFAFFVIGPALTLVAAIAEPWRKHVLPFAIALWLISWGSILVARQVSYLRTYGLMKSTERAQPLIDAIEAYNDEWGSYPSWLEELVPDYIDEIPGTGMISYPAFEYDLGAKGDEYEKYQLSVDVSEIFNWDRFFYWPEQGYPSKIGTDPVYEIGDWAYWNE